MCQIESGQWGINGVWLDAWLPYNDHPRSYSPIVEGFEEARVADLIDPSTKQWDSSLLQGLFNPQEVELIQSIRLCNSSAKDKLIQPYTSSGQYTVQSGYRFLAKEISNNLTLVDPNHDNGIWKLAQGLSIPYKVKNFLWRACCDALPTKTNLRKRMILTFDVCDHYNREPENILYALWNCSKLAQIWEALPELSFHRTHSFSLDPQLFLSVRTYVIHLLGTYVTILCNWLII